MVRKITLLLLAALMAVGTFAQSQNQNQTQNQGQNKSIKIVSMTMDPLDQAARNYPKEDANGDLYSIIKVRPACDNLRFSFGYMKCIPDSKPHQNETWLYVQKNARRISISGDGYEPIMNEDLGQTLDAGLTYVLELKFSEEKTDEQAVSSISQYVVFMVNAPNATVRINGKSLFVKDGGASTKLPYGKYDYEVTAPMYETAVGQITVAETGGRIEETVSLIPVFKSVALMAEDGVEIWIDGEKKGVGSWKGDLEYSTYNIECRQDGYRPVSQNITITSDGPSSFSLPSPTPVYGSIEVEVEPLNAEIYLDGKNVGNTPMRLENVLIGNHQVTVCKSGYDNMERTVTVDENMVLTLSGILQIFTTGGTGIHNGHEYVDLGLPSGTLWATCNVGAEKPEDYGDYFAWGETSCKTSFDWSNYKWCNGSLYDMTKYNTSSSYGTVDNKTELELSDDAAYVNWGERWHMPTREQIKELTDNCTVKWITQNGVYGKMITSKKNGNSIFLPAAGFYNGSDHVALVDCCYWSRSLAYMDNICVLYFGYPARFFISRLFGLSIRPVFD